MKILVKDFIFCDDIRPEEGKKSSIMGAYNDKLRIMPKSKEVQKFQIPISAFIRFEQIEIPKKQEFTFKIDVSFDKASIAQIEGTLNFNDERFLTLSLVRLGFEFDKAGMLTFNVTIKDNQQAVVLNYEEPLKIVIEPFKES